MEMETKGLGAGSYPEPPFARKPAALVCDL